MNEPRPHATTIVAIVLTYAAFGALWILLSDKVVSWLISDPATITIVSIVKGWAYVALTSLLLYGLMRRLLGRAQENTPNMKSLKLPLALVTIAIAALTAGGIFNAYEQNKKQQITQLQTIADLKTRQIRTWLQEKDGDTRFVQTNSNWANHFHDWQVNGNPAAHKQLLKMVEDFHTSQGFQGMVLLDEHGTPRWDSSGKKEPVNPALLAAVRTARAGNTVIRFGPYRDHTGHAHLDFIAPLPSVSGRQGPIIVLHTDPDRQLFPELESWPTPTSSGKALLFRRDDDHLLFISNHNHDTRTGTNLRLPIADSNLLAAKVLRGEAQLGSAVGGIDYQGVPVIGVVRAIPGTDWYLLAKLNMAEIYAEVTDDAIWILIAGLLALFVAVAMTFLVRQRQALAAANNERRIQEEKLRALQLLDAIAEGSADAIFVKDSEGRYLLFNRGAARLTGKNQEEVLGRDDRALFPAEQAAAVMANDRLVMTRDQAVTFQEDLTTVDGQLTFLATKGPLHDSEGTIIGMFGISRDISERRRAEEEKEKLQAQLLQAQKMESIGRLAGGVAHDFNNMLSVIIGHAELAKHRIHDRERVRASLEEINTAALRSADLTRQLLAFARKQIIIPKSLDLNETVSGMLKMLRRLIGEDIQLAWLPKAHLWPVRIDPSQVDQILANLAVNARDAISGGGSITIETANVVVDDAYCVTNSEAAPGSYVLLSFSDTGCGMAREVLDHLFEPFFTTKGVGAGTGLGLATVYGIVKQNGGFINVYSEPGMGTTFKIYLPQHSGVIEAQPVADPPEAKRSQGETVLLVEDEAAIITVCRTILEELGYRVFAAHSPGEALRLATTHAGAIRLLITDVVMPEMNGKELAERVSSIIPGIACLYMSGYTANVIAHHGVLDEGINFIQKPFSIHMLADKVRQALECS
jgi:PAS domain S-box-containing protein